MIEPKIEYTNEDKRIPCLVSSGNYVVYSVSSEWQIYWIYDRSGNVYFPKQRMIIGKKLKNGESICEEDIIQYLGIVGEFDSGDLRMLRKAMSSMTKDEISKLPVWFIELFILKILYY